MLVIWPENRTLVCRVSAKPCKYVLKIYTHPTLPSPFQWTDSHELSPDSHPVPYAKSQHLSEKSISLETVDCSFQEFFHRSGYVPRPSANVLQFGGLAPKFEWEHPECWVSASSPQSWIPRVTTMHTIKHVFVMGKSHCNFPRELSCSRTERNSSGTQSKLSLPEAVNNQPNKLLIPSLEEKRTEGTNQLSATLPRLDSWVTQDKLKMKQSPCYPETCLPPKSIW